MARLIKLSVAITICMFFGLNIFASEDKFVYNSHNKRDPFVPLIGIDAEIDAEEVTNGTQHIEYTAINLEGIVYDPVYGSKVIINGQILKAGDEGNGFKVEQILPDRIIVNILGERKIVNLREIEKETKSNKEDTASDKKEDSQSNEEEDTKSNEEE